MQKEKVKRRKEGREKTTVWKRSTSPSSFCLLTFSFCLGLPVFLEVDVAFHLQLRVVRLEPHALEDFDHALRRRVLPGTGVLILERDADHFRVAAEEHVRG